MALYIVAFAMVITILFIIYITSKSPHPFWRAVGSSIRGILGFIFVLISYNYTGITLPINLITLSISLNANLVEQHLMKINIHFSPKKIKKVLDFLNRICLKQIPKLSALL